MISVVMPAYNSERTIKDSINSVLNQTYSDWELIIVNDASSDNTLSIIREFELMDSRVVVLENAINSGVSESRNKGISFAKGDYIAFLDSDDMWRSDKLEKQINLMKRNNAVLSYTASSFISSEGYRFDYIMEAEAKISLKTLLRKNLISCSSAMIRADVMKSIQMPNDKMHEDYYVWICVLRTYGFAYGINEPLLIYRLSSNSKSSSRLKSAKMIFNTYNAVGYNSIMSLFLTLRYSIHSISKRYKINHS